MRRADFEIFDVFGRDFGKDASPILVTIFHTAAAVVGSLKDKLERIRGAQQHLASLIIYLPLASIGEHAVHLQRSGSVKEWWKPDSNFGQELKVFVRRLCRAHRHSVAQTGTITSPPTYCGQDGSAAPIAGTLHAKRKHELSPAQDRAFLDVCCSGCLGVRKFQHFIVCLAAESLGNAGVLVVQPQSRRRQVRV